jgi:hypothetical protein
VLAQRAHPLTPAALVIERAVQQDAADSAEPIGLTTCMLPAGPIDPGTLVSLTARVAAFDPSCVDCRETHGAALYRAGKYSAAVKELEEAVRLTGKGGNNWQNLFLAMAYHKMGQPEPSRERLARVKLNDEASWKQRLIDRRLGRELEEMQKAAPK